MLQYHTRAFTTIPILLSHLVHLHAGGLACDADRGAIDGRDGAGLESQTTRVYSNTASRSRAAAQRKLRISRSLCVCVCVCLCVCVYTHTHTQTRTHTHTLSHTHTACTQVPTAHTNLHTYIHTCGRSHRNTHTCGTHASTPTRLHPLAPAHELVLLSSLSFFLSFFLSLSLSRSRSVSSPSYPHNGLLRF